MSPIVASFLRPYIQVSYAVGSGFLHNLEGAIGGLIFRGPYLDANTPLHALGLLALIVMAVTMACSCAIAFRYSKPLFLAVTGLWLVPGVLAVFFPAALGAGITYDMNFVVWGSPAPRSTGSSDEQLCALALSMAFGWALMSVAAELFGAGKRFRIIFEVAWLVFGLNGALFAAYDAQVQSTKYAISERDRDAGRILSLFEERVSRLKKICENGLSEISPNACRWTAPALYRLRNLKEADDFIRVGIEFPPATEFLTYGGTLGDKKLASKVQDEVEEINREVCEKKLVEMPCVRLPDHIDTILLSKRIVDDFSSPKMFKPFPVVELAQALHETTKGGGNLFDKLRKEIGAINLKWLVFMLFATLTGCKAALHTREIYRDDQGDRLKAGHWGPTAFQTVPCALLARLKEILSRLARASVWLLGRLMHAGCCLARGAKRIAARRSSGVRNDEFAD